MHGRRKPGRTIWCKERSREWWRSVEVGLCGKEWWREYLRMSMETFQTVCNDLRPHIERQVTKFREPVSVEMRVALTVETGN